MQIEVHTIAHKDQRYETVGDWYWNLNKNILHIRVSKMGNWMYEMLVAVHEIHEALLCSARGIDEKDITKFDMEFEYNRKPGDFSEPGDDPAAPYRAEHFFATNLERMFAAELKVDWRIYDETVSTL